LALCALAFSLHEREPEFRDWMLKFNKAYSTQAEYQTRFKVYLAASETVDQLNAAAEGANVTYGLNSLADITPEEFKLRLGSRVSNQPSVALVNAPLSSAPNAFDWCKEGKCSPIKDQGQCGSCWAFATTENIESVHAIREGSLPILAPQQIVDCDTGEAGCGGGDPKQAYQYVRSQGGLDTESYYPYRAVNGNCKFSAAHVGAKINGEANGYGGSEAQMAANLASTAPFSIIVDASSWQYYTGGILPASKCGHSLDHAVVAVGYDISAKYWRVRNSWGAGWGESGYIRLEYNANTCGLRTEVLTSTV
jgi:C1A family cysteine protease